VVEQLLNNRSTIVQQLFNNYSTITQPPFNYFHLYSTIILLSMFRLFKNKPPQIKTTDRIWMSDSAKTNAIIEEWKKNNNTTWLFWSNESLRKVETEVSGKTTSPISLVMAAQVSTIHLAGQKIIFAEHHPSREREQAIYQKLNLQEAEVWSSLEEPLFTSFGGEKIIQLMKQLGMSEEESIVHPMISKAIAKAQEKAAEQ
jgi:hypothetical protein